MRWLGFRLRSPARFQRRQPSKVGQTELPDDHPAPDRGRGYQGAHFEVVEAAGRIVEHLEALLDREGNPEKLLVHLAGSGWSECYLDAWIGFWHFLDDDAVEAVRGDYEGHEVDDLAARLSLTGTPVRRITCKRSTVGTAVELCFDHGTLVFEEVDPSDHASRSRLAWRGAGQESAVG